MSELLTTDHDFRVSRELKDVNRSIFLVKVDEGLHRVFRIHLKGISDDGVWRRLRDRHKASCEWFSHLVDKCSIEKVVVGGMKMRIMDAARAAYIFLTQQPNNNVPPTC